MKVKVLKLIMFSSLLSAIKLAYDFVACNLFTTRLRQLLGHDCFRVVSEVVRNDVRND